MLDVELYILRQILKLMPRFGITFERFEKETGNITSRTLYNWSRSTTIPHRKKFIWFRECLREKYPREYQAIISIINEANKEKIDNIMREEMAELTNNISPYRR